MTISCEKGVFDIPVDFSVEYIINNVILLDQGEQSLPFVFPYTEHNLYLINHSNRLDAYYKPVYEMPVIVIHGTLYYKCSMKINSIDKNSGIDCTIYYNNGDFYSECGDKNLIDLSFDSVIPDGDLGTRVGKLITLLADVYKHVDLSQPFEVAPVLTNNKYKIRGRRMHIDQYGNTRPESADIECDFVLNGFDQFYGCILPDRESIGNRPTTFEAHNAQIHIENNVDIYVERGYGMTPFLKLSYVLPAIFENFGYIFNYADIQSEFEDFEMVVINAVADAIYAGKIEYKNLLPNVKIKDFLYTIESIFGGVFVFNSLKKEVHFIFFKNIFVSVSDLDLTEFSIDEYLLEMPEFKNLSLIDKSNETEIFDLNSKFPKEEISLPLPKTELKSRYFTYTDNINAWYMDWYDYTNDISIVPQYGVNAGNIIHKYSKIQIDREDVSEEKDKTDEKIIIASVKFNFQPSDFMFVDTDDDVFTARHSEKLIPDTEEEGEFPDYFPYKKTTSDLKWLYDNNYQALKDFYANSNVKIQVKMKIPAKILNQIDLSVPKLFFGQRVLIEQITRIIGNDDTSQNVILRTVRNYIDRPV
jgi:hypothetical protein